MNNLNNLVNDNEKNIHRQDIQRKYIKKQPLLLSEPTSGSTNISKQLKYYRDNEYHDEVDSEDNDDNNTVTSSSINVENISNRIDTLENKISSSKHSEPVDDTPNISVKSSLIKESSTDVQKALYKKSKTKYIENIVKPLALKSDMIKKEIQYFIYKSIKNNKYKTRIAAGISRLRKNEIRIAKIRYKDEIKDGLLKSDILKSIDVDIKNTISPQQAASVKLSKLEKQVAIVDKPANDTSDLFSYMKKLENRVELLESESPDDTESSNTKNIEKDNTLDTLDKNLLDIKAFFGLDKSKVSTLAASGRIQDIDNNIIQVTKNTEEIKRELLLLSKPKKVVSDISVAKDRDFDKPKDLEKREKDQGNVGSTGGLLDGIMNMLSKIVGGALLSGLARKFLKAIMPGGKDKAPKAGKKMPGGVDVPDAKNKKPSFMDKLKNSKVVGGLAKAGKVVAKAGKFLPYVGIALAVADTALTYNDAFGISSVKDFSVGKTVSSLVGSVVGTLELIGVKDAGVDSARWFQKHVGSVIDSGISKISGSDGEEKLNNVIEAKEIQERKESFAKEVQALKSTANKSKNKEMSKEDKVSFGFDLLIALSKSEAIKIDIKTELLPNEVIAANNFAFTGGEFITEETDPTNILENYFITSIAPNRLEQLDQQLANLDKDSLDSLFLVVVKDEKTKNRVLKDTPARYDMKDIINARLQGKSVKTLKLTSIPEPAGANKTTASSMYEKVKSAAATTGGFIGTAAKSAGKFVSATASSITSAVSSMNVKDTVKSAKATASSIFSGISSAATATTDALKSAANTVSKVTGTAFMTSDVKAKVLDIVTKGTGLDTNTIEKIISKESSGNPRAKTGSYLGLFQMGEAAMQTAGMQYGEKLYDPIYNATAFAKYYNKVSPAIKSAGIPPTAAALYMLHQQGSSGFPTLWKIAATGKIPKNVSYDLPNNMVGNVIGHKAGQRIYKSARQFLSEWYNSFGEKLPIPDNVGGYSNTVITPDVWEANGNRLEKASRADRKGTTDIRVASLPKQINQPVAKAPVQQPVKVAKAPAVAKPVKESKISSPVEASQINNTNIASNQEMQNNSAAPTARVNINSNNQSQSNDVKQTVLQMDKFGVESTFDKSASVNMNKGV